MDDDDLGFGSAPTKRSAKTGRRAATTATPAPALEEEELTAEPAPTKKTTDGPPGRPNKTMAGWGEEAPAPRKPRQRQLGEGFETMEDERLKQGSPDKGSDSDSDIPVIPELEDQTEDDFTSKVAAAPNVAVNRVATYRELDNDLLKQAAFLTLDNEVDLKLLTKTLSPLDDLIEYDKPWEWDRLFTEVSSELRADLDNEDNEEEGDKTVEPVT